MITKEIKTEPFLELPERESDETTGYEVREILRRHRLIRFQKNGMPDGAARKGTAIAGRFIAEDRTGSAFKIGIGFQETHWGELCQGPVHFKGRTITALLTLPRGDLWTVAVFQPQLRVDVHVEPAYAEKSARAVRIALDSRGFLDVGGKLILLCNIQTVGCGAGSSTCNVVAAVRSVNAALNLELSDLNIQRITQLVEGASDPLALISDGTVVIYGSRSGEIITELGQSLPSIVCLGFVTSPGKVVYTEELLGNEQYDCEELSAFQKILNMAETAIESGRLDLLAKAATESGCLNQRQVPIRNHDEIIQAASENGALGVSVSHSGTVGAALYDPTERYLNEKIKSMAEILHHLGCDNIQQFIVNAA